MSTTTHTTITAEQTAYNQIAAARGTKQITFKAAVKIFGLLLPFVQPMKDVHFTFDLLQFVGKASAISIVLRGSTRGDIYVTGDTRDYDLAKIAAWLGVTPKK